MSTLDGQLSRYPTEKGSYPFFTTGKLDSTKAVVFIGGLYGGLLEPGYLPDLSIALQQIGWKLVLMHWSGAYGGFGTGSLDRDRQEMSDLVAHLRSNGTPTIVLMGHSTGSQDVIHYLSSTQPLTPVQGGIMQAPVSDREWVTWSERENPLWTETLETARHLVKEGKGEQLLGKAICDQLGCHITAYRFHSMFDVGGDDDYFSSDLPEEASYTSGPQLWKGAAADDVHVHPLSNSFGKLSAPALALYSEKDECCRLPSITDTLARWSAIAKGKLVGRVLKGTNHSIDDDAGRQALCREVVQWLQGL